MPKIPVEDKTWYLGIDPGEEGGMSIYRGGATPFTVSLAKLTEMDTWEWIRDAAKLTKFALIEQQSPRPMMVFDHELKKIRPRILKSTCLLYGSYLQLHGMLTAAGIPFADCPPKRWQDGLNIPKKEKGEETRHWKNRLKTKAQHLFPKEKVTLAIADSLLIGYYAWRSHVNFQTGVRK